MTKQVLITVTGSHSVDGVEQDPVVTTAKGTYNMQKGHHYIRYEEQAEGAPVATSNLVKFYEGYLSVTKKGHVSSQMIFEKGKMNVTNYHTPAGILEMGVEAEAITLTEADKKLEIAVDYALHAGGSKVQNSRVVITVVPYPFL